MSLTCRIFSIIALLLCTGSALADSAKALEAYQKGKFKTAFLEFRKSALKGNPDAEYNIAVMLYSGKGVVKDKARAVYWFVKAAQNGDVSAQYNLGVLYSTDNELPNDYPKMDQGEIYFEVSQGARTSRQQKAFTWYKKAAEQGHVSAALNLGVMYNQGIGIKLDYKNAIKWYKVAADKGSNKAQLNLGILYDLGRGTKRDVVLAAKYYRKAAEKGMRDAQYNLGIIYYNGTGGIKRDYLESYAWLALAKEQGSELASIYKDKVERKFDKAVRKKARNLAVKYYRLYLKPFLK